MRRSLLGYRPADVERALAEAEAGAKHAAEQSRVETSRAEALEVALRETRAACAARDQRLSYLEAELELSRSHAASQIRGLALLGAELEELRVTARGRATRIRLAALREAAKVSSRARALAEAEDPASTEPLLSALEAAIDRLGSEWDEDPEQPRAGAREEHPADLAIPAIVPSREKADSNGTGDPVATGPATNGSGAGPAAGEGAGAGAPSGQSGRVSVDVGPFEDFSQLVSFEDAANAIGATGEISIRRFSGGRANIDVDLSEPIDLLEELEQRCDLRFDVRRRSDDEIVLDLGE